MHKIKEELALKEAQKQAEAKKRGTYPIYKTLHMFPDLSQNTEKIDDARARAAVKAQIEADKKARAEKAALEKALREGRVNTGASIPVDVPKPAAVASNTAGRNFKDTRLQIRMSTGGAPLTTTLTSDARKTPISPIHRCSLQTLLRRPPGSCRVPCIPEPCRRCGYRHIGTTFSSVCLSLCGS